LPLLTHHDKNNHEIFFWLVENSAGGYKSLNCDFLCV